MSKIEIFTLGDFRVIVDGSDIVHNFKHSPQKLRLLEYLIVNMNRVTPKADLIEVLWDGSEGLNMENSLKTLVSRLRKDLADYGLKNAVVTKQGAYAWNIDLDAKLDILRLEELCGKLLLEEVLNEEVREEFEEVLFLYGGDMLANSGLESWLAAKIYYFHNLFFKTMYHYIGFLSASHEYGQVIRVCKTVLEVDVFDTKINLELMRALMLMGKRKEALAQYQNISDLNYIHMGTKPDDEILEFYKQFLLSEHNPEATIEEISKELQMRYEVKGALVCEYSLFKDIYRLYMRNLKRLGISIFLSVVSIQTMGVHEVEPLELDKAMSTLKTLLQDRLRTGDTISRYSLSQFAVLLPNVSSFDNGRMVMKRIQSSFYENTDHTKYKFEFRIIEIRAES